MTLSTRMAVMDRGQVQQVGTPTEIYEFPQTRFTADFIGSINLFEGEVTHADGSQVKVRAEGHAGELVVESTADVRAGQRVWVAVRPEKIAVRRDENEQLPETNAFRGVVRDVAYLGDSSIYRVDVGLGEPVEVMQPNVFRSTEREIDWDDPVVLTWTARGGLVLTE